MIAQLQPGKPNDLDSKYLPDKSSIFNSDINSTNNSSTPKTYSQGVIEIKNLVKCNLGLFARNIFALSYERFFTDQISAEGSLGLAYNKDIIFGAIGSALDLNSSNSSNSALALENIYMDGKKSSLGLYTGASIKFHFSGGGCSSMGYGYYSGWNIGSGTETYLELGIRYYGNHLQLVDDPSAMSNVQSGTYNYTPLYNNLRIDVRQINFLLNYGIRFTTTGNIKTSHEFYCGVGLRNFYYNVTEKEKVTIPQNFPLSTITYERYYKTDAIENRKAAMVVFGYILGFGWNN